VGEEERQQGLRLGRKGGPGSQGRRPTPAKSDGGGGNLLPIFWFATNALEKTRG
jgi:hypothetical protein